MAWTASFVSASINSVTGNIDTSWVLNESLSKQQMPLTVPTSGSAPGDGSVDRVVQN